MDFNLEYIPVQASQIAATLRKPSMENVAQLAKNIHDRWLVGISVRKAVSRYASICCAIDKAKVNALGMRSNMTFCNHLMHMIAVECARQLSFIDITDLMWVKRQAEVMSKSPDSLTQWLYPKIEILGRELNNKGGALEFISHFSFSTPLTELLLKSFGNSRSAVDGMFVELLKLRRYGVKNSFFKDRMMCYSGSVWSILDPDAIFEKLPSEKIVMSGNPLALIFLAEENQVANLGQPRAIFNTAGDAVIHGVELGAEFHLGMMVDERGELDFTSGYLPGSMRELCEKEGKGFEYEIFRLSQAIRLFDLLVPVQVAESMPSLSGQGMVQRLIQKVTKKHQLPITPDLLLPRIRILEKIDMLLEQTALEVERAEEETAKRSVRKHDVTEHIRQLPSGKHPSAQAKKLALERFGIVLGENETFVRKHYRGKGEEICMHRAVVR